MTRRKDYLSNLKKKRPSGCTWCGADVAPPVSTASYCSDACLQADNAGIEDQLPATPLQHSNGADTAYVQHKWAAYNLKWGGGHG